MDDSNNTETYGSWLISSIGKVDIIGKITKMTIGENDGLESVFVEAQSAEKGNYDKANVIVTFTDDPRIMIYPVYSKFIFRQQ